ncbi:hypothetical protein [Planctomicrobium sp. SH664]|uniref:hypothetical protein n=1 Tax=Planctomicrobium sp. SH664 TaxID=3448125 RepID=UPI003F5BB626
MMVIRFATCIFIVLCFVLPTLAAEPLLPHAPAANPSPAATTVVPTPASPPSHSQGVLSAPVAPVSPEVSGSFYTYGDSYWSAVSPASTPAQFSQTPGYPRNLGGVAPGTLHERYPYYSYRRPWYTPGPVSQNVTIVW